MSAATNPRDFRLVTLWVVDRSDPGRLPYLLESYDEIIEDSHGGTPDFFMERLRKLEEQGEDEYRIIPVNIDYRQVQAAFETKPIDGDVGTTDNDNSPTPPNFNNTTNQ